jgi:hypothetical protein
MKEKFSILKGTDLTGKPFENTEGVNDQQNNSGGKPNKTK